jgi:hypothetical protein
LSAFDGTSLALVRAPLAMVHVMLPAFCTTRFANVGTDGADLLHEIRAAAHVGSREKANLRAIVVHPNTIGHFGYVCFVQAGICTMLAFLCTPQTGIDTHLVFLM